MDTTGGTNEENTVEIMLDGTEEDSGIGQPNKLVGGQCKHIYVLLPS